MVSSRTRRRVVVLAVLAGLVGALAAYRRRELARNAQDFDTRYG